MTPRDVDTLTADEYAAMVEYMNDLARRERQREERAAQRRRMGRR